MPVRRPRTRRTALLGLVSLLTLLMVGPPRVAVAFVCAQVNGHCVHWEGGVATLRSFLGSPHIEPLMDGSMTWDDSARGAADDWNGVSGAFHFTVDVGGQLHDPCPGGTGEHACSNTGAPGDNPVFFVDTFCGRTFGDILQLTNACYRSDTGAMVNAPVFVNSNVRWNAYDGPTQYTNHVPISDIRRALLHEFGHVLGLAHPDDHGQAVKSIMNSRIGNTDRLQPDDIAGLLSIYACGAGDCGGDGQTTTDELISMVNIALGTESLAGCIAADLNHDGMVSIDEIVRAVTAALDC